MSQTYQIFTDSSCDLPQERADAYELHVVPLTVQMNGKSYRNELDGREIAFSDFYAALRAGTPASTSAVNPEAFRAEMEPVLQAGIDILYIGFSSGLSTTYPVSYTHLDVYKRQVLRLRASHCSWNAPVPSG